MQINSLKSRNLKSRKRVGRGGKSGTYSGKGMKGQKARSGYSRRSTWEGGRTTLIASTKKNKGFKSRNAKNQVVSLDSLEENFKDGDKITPETLKEAGLINDISVPVKILNNGELKKKLEFKDVLISGSAKKGVETS
jgi:large subunit ribosomal protein L15